MDGVRSEDWYAGELKAVEEQRNSLRALDKSLNLARAVLFFGGILLLALGWASGDGAPTGARLLWWGGWLVLAGFFAVVTVHEGHRRRIEALRNRRSVLRRLVARRERRWDRLNVWKVPRGIIEANGVEAGGVADDLDLFGSGSLMQLVSMAYTGPGLRTLAAWLTGAAIADSASARSVAARSLVRDRAGRLRFYELARVAAGSAAEPDAFADWASGQLWLQRRQWLRIWAFVAPISLVVLFLVGTFVVPIGTITSGNAAGAAAEPATGGADGLNWAAGLLLAAIPVLINLGLTVWTSGPVHAIFAKAVHRRGDIDGYAEMFAAGERLPSDPKLIGDIRDHLVGDRGGAATGMRRLGRLANLVAMRRGGISYILFTILQLICLWDIHLLAKLEAWQQQHGGAVRQWFDALGQLEALQSLAALYDDYPQWAVPTWVPADAQAVVRGKQVAHPLLKDEVRVANDVTIGPRGSLLLVTGSNMSGKSTMLRSMGLNVVLAGAGAPVCAEAFSLPSIELATSIRVRDSVKEGVSFYMAELHRLRDVVQHAKRLAPTGDRVVLYLLDEILQGTNSRERSVAVVRVLRHLLDSGAIGAISTHDLELAEDTALTSVSHVVHFRETIDTDPSGAETMRFDYRMREGVTPTTNALRLLELVGLGINQTTDSQDPTP
jgi:hypothetical protein